jgi:predicted nucleic acid-binding protein
LTVATHDKAVELAKRYGMPIYDATIAASALEAGCEILYSEDFQHAQKLDGLTVLNPFR